MYKNIIKVMIMVAFVLIGVSCNDSYLEELNPNGINTVQYYSTLSETEAGLAAAYHALMDEEVFEIKDETVRSDLGFWGKRTQSTGNSYLYQSFLSTDAGIENKWNAYYQGIFRANQVIEGLEMLWESDKLTTIEEELLWKQQMGQARFLRGLFHFFAHSVFRGSNGESIIIRDNVPVLYEDMMKGLSQSQEVIDFFRADFKYAKQYLPYEFLSSDNVRADGKATKGAAAAALANSYLYEAQYDSAIVVYEDLINNSAYGYSLEQDYDKLFTSANGEFNSESIFEVNYTTDVKIEAGQWDKDKLTSLITWDIATTAVAGRSNLTPAAWLAYSYKTEIVDSLDTRNTVQTPIGESVIRPVSLRASNMVALAADLYTPFYLDIHAVSKKAFSYNHPCYWRKYTHHDIVATEKDSPAGNKIDDNNIIVYRLSEVYLNLAECYMETGNVTRAISLMNEIRERWALRKLGVGDGSVSYDGINYEEVSKLDTLKHILRYNDKPLELSAEGHSTRAIDMRRWGIAKERFSELSKDTFHLASFSWYDYEKGANVDAGYIEIKKGSGSTEDEFNLIEFEQAARNYTDEENAYLPIPAIESDYNQQVNN